MSSTHEEGNTPPVSRSPSVPEADRVTQTADRSPAIAPSEGENASLFKQLSADFAEYEAKTAHFFKNLLSTKRHGGGATGALEHSPSPLRGDPLMAGRPRPVTTTLDHDHDDDDDSGGSDSLSDDSQNLKGFESVVEDDDDDTTGECSSSNSEVFRSYRQRRMQMIMANHQGDSSAAFSSEGESGVRGRGRSVTPTDGKTTRGSRTRALSAATHRSTRSATSEGGSLVGARDVSRIESLRTAVQSAAIQQRAASPPHSSVPPLHTCAEGLDRKRLAAVLHVSKHDEQRAVRLALRYATLIDRLGLEHVQASDFDLLASRRAVVVLDSHVTVDGGKPRPICKDLSNLIWIEARRLPPQPPTKDERSRRDYATNVIRFLLFLLERRRFSSSKSASSAALCDGNTATPKAADSSPPSGEVRDEDTQYLPESPLPASQPQPNTTNKPAITGASRKRPHARRSGRQSGTLDRGERFTCVIDVDGCESSTLSALVPLLSEGEELLCASYPLRISRVIVYHGGPPVAPALEQRETRVDSTAIAVHQSNAKKGPLQMISSLFGPKKVEKQHSSTTTSPPKPSSSLASKLWLSVMVSTWKLRFLQPTVRQRTLVSETLDPFLDTSLLRAALLERNL